MPKIMRVKITQTRFFFCWELFTYPNGSSSHIDYYYQMYCFDPSLCLKRYEFDLKICILHLQVYWACPITICQSLDLQVPCTIFRTKIQLSSDRLHCYWAYSFISNRLLMILCQRLAICTQHTECCNLFFLCLY